MDPSRARCPISTSTSASMAARGHRLRPPQIRPRRPDHHLRNAQAARPRSRTSAGCWAVPLTEVERITKLIPGSPNMTLDKALEQEPDLKRDVRLRTRRSRRSSTSAGGWRALPQRRLHAAGVIISDQPLDNLVPLYKPRQRRQLITQFDGPIAEKCGLLKMDFLGLRTLLDHRARRPTSSSRTTASSIDLDRRST